MKRIINGVAYNTDTSTLVAQSEDEDDPEYARRFGSPQSRYDYKLYQTRGGAFFLHIITTTQRRNPRTEEMEEIGRHEFEALTREQAEKWTLEGDNVELLADNVFGDVPEAEEEETAGVTVYVRMPTSLKQRIVAEAESKSISVNALMIQAAERMLQGVTHLVVKA